MSETHAGETAEAPRRIGRAVFLTTLLGGVSSLAWGKSVWGPISSAISPLESIVPLVPTKGWRIYTVSGSLPSFDEATWRLQVGGHVDRPVSLGYRDLLSLPKHEQVSTFHCVTGWTVKNVHWGGVRLSDVIGPARPQSQAHALEFVSAERPYVDSLTLQQAALNDVMLAYEMDGRPLKREHGAPLRLVIPEMYGYKNVKWLNAVNLVPKQPVGYWEGLGYDQNAWVGHSNGYGSS
jgi:DMSO/TMAO reductase YedYZ molybdopterin-dependent catalytic subunit